MTAPPKPLTDPARFFLEPQQPRHRQYEALRAYFAEGMPSTEAAQRFGYTAGAFRVLCHAFRHGGHREFFIDAPRGPQVQTKKDPARPLIIAVTGLGEYTQRLRSYEVGIDLHLVKPVNPEELKGFLNRYQNAYHPGR